MPFLTVKYTVDAIYPGPGGHTYHTLSVHPGDNPPTLPVNATNTLWAVPAAQAANFYPVGTKIEVSYTKVA